MLTCGVMVMLTCGVMVVLTCVVVQKYMRRRKYRVHAAFLSATMINAIDAPVEFEVSIGKSH